MNKLLSLAAVTGALSLAACFNDAGPAAPASEKAGTEPAPGFHDGHDPLEGMRGDGPVRKGYLYGHTEITYKEINGKKVLDGDIVLSPEQVTDLPVLSKESGAGRSESKYYWPSRIVYYTINSNVTNQARITNAMRYWSYRFNFVVRTNQANYIEFKDNGDGCYSDLGMQGGRQELGFDSGCSTGNAIHEIGHALGLYHEQSRSDRDTYITVNWGNIESGKSHNFETYVEQGVKGFNHLPMDWVSVMMYDSWAFSKNGNATMTRKDGSTWNRQRLGPSAGDIATIDRMYPPVAAAWINPVARSSNQIDIFTARSSDGVIRTAAWDATLDANGAYRGWWSVAGGVSGNGGQVTAVARASTKLDAFTVGTNGRVFTAAWDQNVDGANGFRGWWTIGTLTTQPGAHVAPVVMASNKIQVFAVDNGNRIMTSYWDGNSSGSWTAWSHVQGGIAASGTEPVAFKRSNGKVSLAVVGQDGRMYTAEGSFGSWAGFWDRGNVGGGPITQLSGLERDASNSEYIALGANGLVYHRTYNTSTGWTNWATISSTQRGSGRRVALVKRGSTLHAFVIGTDRLVYHATKASGASWSSWSTVSGLTTAYGAQVGAVARNSSEVQIFASTGSNNYSNTWTSTGWKGWKLLPSL